MPSNASVQKLPFFAPGFGKRPGVFFFVLFRTTATIMAIKKSIIPKITSREELEKRLSIKFASFSGILSAASDERIRVLHQIS
jgi:hypothetical protein